MKTFITITLLALLFAACSKEAEIVGQPKSVYQINGKLYKFVAVVPADHAHPVWIFVPVDSATDVPLVTRYQYRTSNGKSGSVTHYINAVVIK